PAARPGTDPAPSHQCRTNRSQDHHRPPPVPKREGRMTHRGRSFAAAAAQYRSQVAELKSWERLLRSNSWSTTTPPSWLSWFNTLRPTSTGTATLAARRLPPLPVPTEPRSLSHPKTG